eukprot:CAMPEP_0119136610 /NCGR_PEP_ID=MMETSP1310-20130426/21788_1 /TAXON_ID=464262 /ORGANISM="Genus nov. species nov., Strain RCC2339" /LENGTH=261 /DNA_ID=CAMNT_0007127617 /DNA_START=39 /DNA_END=824 /DNA_ORIENTATION=+
MAGETADLLRRGREVAAQYYPSADHCKFNYILYNLTNPELVGSYQRPSNVSEVLWKQAVRDNPDPSRLIPVSVTGFSELKERIQKQEETAKEQRERLVQIRQFLVEVQRKHEIETTAKITDYKREFLNLSHRMLQVLGRVELVQSRDVPLQADEDLFRAQLDQLQADLNRPGQYKSSLHEITAKINLSSQSAPAADVRSRSLDADTVRNMQGFLKQQQEGILHLADILKKDMAQLEKLSAELKGRSSHLSTSLSHQQPPYG